MNEPCIRGRPSGLWTPAWRSSRRSKARQRRHRPVAASQHLPRPQQYYPATGPPASQTYHSELLEGPGLLDVGQRLVQVLQLQVDLGLGGLGILDGLGLEGGDGLELAGDVVGGGLEGLEALLDLVDDGLVLEDGAVLGEVDLGGELRQLLDPALGVVVARLEGLQGRDRLATEAQGGGDLGPVELEGCGSLRGRRDKISSGSLLARLLWRMGSEREDVLQAGECARAGTYCIIGCSGGQLVAVVLTVAIFANDT